MGSILSGLPSVRDQRLTPHPRAVAEEAPDRPALIMADRGQSISYRELVERSDRAANLFASLGLVEGDTVR